jgi:hypothetical protein
MAIREVVPLADVLFKVEEQVHLAIAEVLPLAAAYCFLAVLLVRARQLPEKRPLASPSSGGSEGGRMSAAARSATASKTGAMVEVMDPFRWPAYFCTLNVKFAEAFC